MSKELSVTSIESDVTSLQLPKENFKNLPLKGFNERPEIDDLRLIQEFGFSLLLS